MAWKDWAQILPPIAIVRVPTREDAAVIERLVKEVDFITVPGLRGPLQLWDEYKEQTCYNLRFEGGRLSYASYGFYKNEYRNSPWRIANDIPPEQWYLCTVEEISSLVWPEVGKEFQPATNDDLISLLFE